MDSTWFELFLNDLNGIYLFLINFKRFESMFWSNRKSMHVIPNRSALIQRSRTIVRHMNWTLLYPIFTVFALRFASSSAQSSADSTNEKVHQLDHWTTRNEYRFSRQNFTNVNNVIIDPLATTTAIKLQGPAWLPRQRTFQPKDAGKFSSLSHAGPYNLSAVAVISLYLLLQVHQ